MNLRVAAVAVVALVLTLTAVSGVWAQQKDIKVFGDVRFRGEAYDNFWNFDDQDKGITGVKKTADDSAQYFRLRTHVGADARLAEGVRAYVLFVNEYRPGNAQIAGNDRTVTAVENAFLQLSEFAGLPLTVTIGRQNLVYGEGWIVLEGTPQDGSTTIAFDALKLSYDLSEYNKKIDLFGAKISEGATGTADDSDFYGLYVTDTTFPCKLEYYYLLLHQNADYFMRAGALASRRMPEKTVDTIGARLSGKITDQLSFATEWGKQFGRRRNVQDTDYLDIDAFAGYAHATYAFDADMSPTADLGYWFYSGDGDATSADGKYTGWDPMFSEWPYISELYVYSTVDLFDVFKGPQNAYNAVWGIPDNDPDYGSWTNMHMAQVGGGVSPTPDLKIALHYQLWYAPKPNGPGGGNERGRNIVFKTTYQLTDNVSTHLYGEYFNPGDYYLASADDAWFARWQVMVKF